MYKRLREVAPHLAFGQRLVRTARPVPHAAQARTSGRRPPEGPSHCSGHRTRAVQITTLPARPAAGHGGAEAQALAAELRPGIEPDPDPCAVMPGDDATEQDGAVRVARERQRLRHSIRACGGIGSRLFSVPPPLTPPAFPLSPGLPVTRYAAAYASSVSVAGISPIGPVKGAGAVTVAWSWRCTRGATSSVRLSLSNRADRWPAPWDSGGPPALASQSSAGSFTKVRKKSSTCRIASVNRSRLTGLVMYALACSR